jgi:hypothetical protein
VRPDGTMEVLPAHEYGPLVLEYEYLEDFVPDRTWSRCARCCGRICTRTRRARLRRSLLLNETQKREALDLMNTSSAGDAREDCGGDCEACGRVGGAVAGGRLGR